MGGLTPAAGSRSNLLPPIIRADRAARWPHSGVTMMEIRCGRCDRTGRLSVRRLVAQH